MKRLTLVLAVGLLFLSISCGGGGGTTLPPANRDLSGLEGTWLIAFTFSGSLNCDGETGTFADSTSATWQISQNSIVANGNPFVWSYDGSVLTVNTAGSFQDWDSDCGTMTFSSEGQIRINITPGATFANLTGNGDMTVSFQYCDNCSGKVTYSGTIAKQ
jgi:hypothetical protein